MTRDEATGTMWKMQRPITTNDSFPQMMCSEQGGKRRVVFLPYRAEWWREVFGTALKVYVLAEVKGGKLVINEILEGDQT